MNTQNDMLHRESDSAEKIQQRPTTAPLVDIYENAEELLVVADLPGVGKEQLSIHLEKGQLTIEGRRTEKVEGNILAAEYRPLDFRRTFVVPQGIDINAIAADLSHGILRVHLPKSAALKPRQIEIKTA